jgi:hypothetical protein
MAKTVVLCLCLVLALAAPAAGKRAGAPNCPAGVPNTLSSTGSATQLITVVAPTRSSTRGSLRIWRKVDGCWRPVAGPWTAWLGGRGGSFGIGPVMYGVAPNPGVRYRYRRIVCGDWWVEDPRSPYYNQFRHIRCGATPPFRVTTGDMSESPKAYRHLAFIRFNTDPVVPGRGSAIFLHADTGRPTLGCISLPVPRLVRTLRWLRPASAPRIVIGTPADLRRL